MKSGLLFWKLVLASLFLASCAPFFATAQCLGYAQALTTEASSGSCDDPFTPPELSWSFRLDCYDECGTRWTSTPPMSATAYGECAIIPPTECYPYFVQKDYTNGLYGTTNAWDQTIFSGCKDEFLVVTQADCPCAPDCTTQEIDGDGSWTDEEQKADDPVDGVNEDGTPVILSLEDGNFSLSSTEDPVLFDLLATGDPGWFSWTARGSDEAFLVLDRNGDGKVNDGRELFGDHSPQLPSAEPNGFRALAVYDEVMNGGNGDGWIDARDPIFEHLLLWLDGDHDGVTDSGELMTLSQGGVEALSVEYRTVGRRDAHGNVYRYEARVIRSVGEGAPIAWDVIFQRADPE